MTEPAAPLFDPFSGVQVDDSGNVISGGISFNDYYSGTFQFKNGVITPLDNPFLSVFLGQQGPFQMQPLRGGRYILTSEVTPDRLNTALNIKALRTVSGNIDVNIGSDTVSFNIDQARLAGIGKQWISYPQKGGTTGYETYRGPFNNDADVAAIYGKDAKLATPEEAAYAAVFAQIISENQDELNRFIAEYGLVDDSEGKAAYKAASMIIREGGLSNLRAFTQVILE